MRFFQTLLAGAAFVAAAFAVEINDFPSEVQVGRSYRITYTPGDNTPTTFVLRKGKNENLDTLGTLTTTATGGSFTWNVASNLANGDDYALEVRQGSSNNFIGPIKVSGSNATPTPSASSAASSAASSSAASSSAATTPAPSSMSTATSASASVSVSSAASNGTVSSAKLSSTATGAPSSTGSSTVSAGAPQNTGAASTLSSSPLALVFGAIAAIAYLN